MKQTLKDNEEELGDEQVHKHRNSGIPTGNAGEYFVMGELLRRGYDAQLADRNTKGYDVLIGVPDAKVLSKVQVKTVRAQPWYVKLADFQGDFLDRVTVYVLLGPKDASKAVRFFIAKNAELLNHIHRPPKWEEHGFMPLKAVLPYENNWDSVLA